MPDVTFLTEDRPPPTSWAASLCPIGLILPRGPSNHLYRGAATGLIFETKCTLATRAASGRAVEDRNFQKPGPDDAYKGPGIHMHPPVTLDIEYTLFLATTRLRLISLLDSHPSRDCQILSPKLWRTPDASYQRQDIRAGKLLGF